MVAIELTKKHKEKLLEMCKTLFPNVLDVPDKIDEDLSLNTTFINIRNEVYLNKGTPNEEYISNDYSIHWFEFCLTHLRYKLNLSGNDYHTIGDVYFSNDLLDGVHPVDYLYEQFKKLK